MTKHWSTFEGGNFQIQKLKKQDKKSSVFRSWPQRGLDIGGFSTNHNDSSILLLDFKSEHGHIFKISLQFWAPNFWQPQTYFWKCWLTEVHEIVPMKKREQFIWATVYMYFMMRAVTYTQNTCFSPVTPRWVQIDGLCADTNILPAKAQLRTF